MNNNEGFTLIELMIVVAIIGILSMIALPAYQDYTRKTYVSEGISLSSSARMAATEYFVSNGRWPKSNTEAGLAAANQITGQGVDGVALSDGKGKSSAIVVYYNQKVTGDNSYRHAPTDGTLTEVPEGNGTLAIVAINVDSGAIRWKCNKVNGKKSLVGSNGAGMLNVKWLPTNCRSDIPLPEV